MNTHAIFLSFFFVLSSLVADDARKLAEQPISVIGEVAPCAFVNDTVNVVDGSFYLRMHHLSVPGHVPLDLVQYYNSQSNYSSWFGTGMSLNYSFWMQGSSDVKEGHDYMGLYAEAPGGSIIACIAKASESSQEYYLDPKVVHEHFTNCSSGHISARTNLKNTRIKEKVDDDYEWTACLADGTRRYYKKSEYQNNIVNVKEEKRRNYTSLRFDYHSGDDMLKPIKRIEAYGKSKLNWLEFDRKNKERKAKVKAANDKCAHFYSFKKDGSHYINRIVSSDCPERRFSYTKAGKYYSIDRVDMPDGRFLEVQYDDKGRVIAQKAPVGKDGDKRTIWHFDYAKEHTTVTNANGHKKVYRHKKGRISRVEEYTGESLYRTKAYYWGAKEGLSWGKQPKGNEGNLLAYATLNHEGCGVSLCYYDYDDYGNIVKETLCGNLSGSYPWPFWIDDEGRPKDPNVEQYRKYYKYSSDHLLIEQSEDYGPTIEYRYKPGTDLMWAKLVKDGDKIVQREFYEHNDDGIVVEKIVDDGDSDNKSWMSGVTYRLVTHIEPVRHKEGYGQGLPQEVWENYYDLEAAKLVLLKHTHYNYNRAGSVTEEAVFDANNNYRYSTWYEYDHKNRLHKKTDPIGQVQTYVYDDNDNKTYEKQENRDVHTIFSYDKANRLIEATEYHYDNSEVNARFEYDLMGNKTASYDRYGYKTSCEYDELSRLRKIVLPKKRYTIEKEYDIFDNVVREVNPKGTAISKEYTIRKNPCRIVYEDLSQERLEYNKKGTLFKKWDRAGTRTLYRYDRLGRVVKTTVSDPEGTILLRTHNTYNGFHLLSSCDPRGTTTQYKYDYAGRKVEELIESAKNYSKTTFEYDSLGRIGCTKRFYGKERDKFVACHFEYDNLDRITLEKQTDSQGVCKSWTYYEYDAMGNCTLKRSGHTDEDAELQNRYNSKGELVEAQDEYGSTTKIAYNHAFSNKKGQKTLQKRVVDALGNCVEEYYDILGRLISQVRKNPDGALTHATDYQYNATGQKIRQIERVVVDGVVDRNYEVTWKYDAQDRLIRLTEQPHTADEKVTRYSYDVAGRVAKITKPDGVVLEHTYDALSRLLTLVSSDNSVAYRYSYDRNNNIRKVVDEVTGIVTERRYDAWNRLTKDGGVHHSYDALGRLKKLTIPDGSQVAYHYGDLHLRAIERLSSDNMLLYEHRYLAFDLKHRPLVCEHIKEVGRAHVGWDKKGRNVLSDSRYYSHTILKTGFDAVGNVKNYSYSDPQGKETVFYSYDDLYQLSHEQGHEEHSYRHDSLNNRLAKDAAAYQIDSQNKIIAAESCTYSYDKNGNMTSDGTKSYSYDALDRLIKVTEGEKETCYTYDSFNRRIRRNNEQFIYQDMREIGCMQDGVVTQFRVLGIGKGAELGASIALELEGKLYCPLHDFRGNIVCLIDTATNQVSESYRYTAFGECQVYTSPDQKFNPWRFASKRFDPETGFTYFSRRYYDPTLGRFVTPDPIGFTDGPNLYAYVHNNPINRYDFFGLLDEDGNRTVGERLSDYLSDGCRALKSFVSKTVEAVAFHLPHVGGINDKIVNHARSWRGEGPKEQPPAGLYKVHSGSPTASGCAASVYANGILNDFVGAIQNLDNYMDLLSGNLPDMYLAFSPSQGFCTDVGNAMLNMIGGKTANVRAIAAGISALVDDVANRGEGYYIDVVPHSNGGQTFNLASRSLTAEQKSRISVRGFASTKIFNDRQGFRSAENYMGLSDIVPVLADPFGVLYSCFGLNPLSPVGHPFHFPCSQHSFVSPEYSRALIRSTNFGL